MSATLSPVPAVSVETLAAAFGVCNVAHHQAQEDWAALASERLAERFGPAIGSVLLARVAALQLHLSESQESPGHYERHGAANVLPGLVRAAAACELDSAALAFDRAELESLAAMPSEPLCPHCGRKAEATA